jgi:DNA helicase HerA-like ATPase
VTPDADETVKNGEFVYYEAPADGMTRQIVGRVTGRRPIRLYPDAFMADPRVPPTVVAGMLGYESGQHELFEISVRILGYYERDLGDFVNPRLPPRSGRPIFLCSDVMLAQILSKRNLDERGGAHIGSLLSRGPGAVPIVIDAGAFTSTHLAIIASTGAGKSYLAGVLIEELMKPHTRASILIIDPHGEYGTLQEMSNRPEFAHAKDGYRAGVRIFRPEEVKVRVNTLNIGDYRCLLPNLSEPQESVLYAALEEVRGGRGRQWGLNDLMVTVRRKGYDDDEEEPTASKKAGKPIQGTVDALLRKLGGMNRSPIFSDSEQLPLSQLYQPGQCTILQLNEIDSREQEVVAATLLRRLLAARMDAEKGKADQESPDYLPYPTFTLIEEAHNFAPASADAVTTYTLRKILAEGRKFGVAVGLISQRPGKLDADMLSQCMTQCIMRIINPVDQDKVAQSVESVGRDLLAELPALSKGQVIIAGSAVNTPVLCRVRKRITSHGAESKNAPDLWYQHASGATKSRRERKYALPAELVDDLDEFSR